jgi:hypothetical protein
MALAIGLVVGYFAGREHVKYQMRTALTDAAQAFAEGFGKSLGGATSAPSVSSAMASTTVATREEDGKKRARDYAESLEIYDFTAAYHDTYEGRVPGVNFKMRNKGDKTLNEVKVVVYFKDEVGNTIAEEDFFPVLTGGFSLENKGPLKPGYVWQQERNHFYVAKRVPSEWKEGAATIAVESIDYAP